VAAPLTRDDFERLARLHREALPDSPLGRLGQTMVERYYRWAASSAAEHIVVWRDGPEVRAAAVVSVDPGAVMRRFVRHAPVAFARAMLVQVAVDRQLRREALAYTREAIQLHDTMDPSPELLQIFVSRECRRRSIGLSLLRDIEAWLRARAIDAYYARTLLDDNEHALGFYRRAGFERVRNVTYCGRAYVLLRRVLPAFP
jgi:ribosomal protein S18 acetylase RimI-like enzyme